MTARPWLSLVAIDGQVTPKRRCARCRGRLGDTQTYVVVEGGIVHRDCATDAEFIGAAERAAADDIAAIQDVGRALRREGESIDQLLERLIDRHPELVEEMARAIEEAELFFTIARRLEDDAFDLDGRIA